MPRSSMRMRASAYLGLIDESGARTPQPAYAMRLGLGIFAVVAVVRLGPLWGMDGPPEHRTGLSCAFCGGDVLDTEPITEVTSLTVRRSDRLFVQGGYAIMLDQHRIGHLENGQSFTTTIAPGEHMICARRLLSFSPPLTFVATVDPIDIECGYDASPAVRTFTARAMRWVQFALTTPTPTADQHT